MAYFFTHFCGPSILPLLSFDTQSFRAEKRKSKKDRFNGISRDRIQREREKV